MRKNNHYYTLKFTSDVSVVIDVQRTKVTKEGAKELILREILEYHRPQLLKDHMNGTEKTTFIYPSLFAGNKNGA